MTQSSENKPAGHEESPENYPLLMQLLGGRLVRHFSQASPTCLNALERISGQIGQSEPNLLAALERAVAANELGRGYPSGISDYSLVIDLSEALQPEYPLFSRLMKIKGFCNPPGEGSDIGLQQLIIPFSEMESPDPLVVDAMLELARGEGKALNINSAFWWVLVRTQDIFDTAEGNGNFRYQDLRNKLNELAIMVIDNDKDGKCLSKVQNTVGANLSRIAAIGMRDEYIEQRDRELNPKYRLLAAQAGQRNVFAQTFYDTIDLMTLSLQKVQSLKNSGVSVHGHEAYEVTNLASLILRTLNMDTAAMVESFKLESKSNLNNFRAASAPLNETALLRELNANLDAVPNHSTKERQSGFTNLMKAIIHVRTHNPAILKSQPEHFYDLLETLLPYASIPEVMASMTDETRPVLEDYIMDRHKELQTLVTLQGKGRAFSTDLGL